MSGAPVVHEFQIRESDPWYGDFVATEGETWFVFAHEFKAYREWAEKWKRVAERAGVCMTCAFGAPDISIGCTDCLNTGWAHGCPEGFVREDHAQAESANRYAAGWGDAVAKHCIGEATDPCDCKIGDCKRLTRGCFEMNEASNG